MDDGFVYTSETAFSFKQSIEASAELSLKVKRLNPFCMPRHRGFIPGVRATILCSRRNRASSTATSRNETLPLSISSLYYMPRDMGHMRRDWWACAEVEL
jgi:hypothetical protein